MDFCSGRIARQIASVEEKETKTGMDDHTARTIIIVCAFASIGFALGFFVFAKLVGAFGL